jgi:hypothetical protein
MSDLRSVETVGSLKLVIKIIIDILYVEQMDTSGVMPITLF